MSEIKLEAIKTAKRPVDLIGSDLERVIIKPTEEELKTIPILFHWAKKMGLEKSNIPELYSNIFEKSVMIQILDPLSNRMVCVDELGNKINTQNSGRDFDCHTCDHFIHPNNDYPNGQCSWALAKFKAKFGDTIPEGLDEMVKASQDETHTDLTQDEVLKLTEGLNE